MTNHSLLILPGDGIGPEVMTEVRKVIAWVGENKGLNFDVSEDLVGGAAYDAHGTPLHDDTMAKAQEVDGQSAACCVCAKKWICILTCARPSALTLWRISRP